MIYVQHRYVLPTSVKQAFELLSNPEFDAVWQKSCTKAQIDLQPREVDELSNVATYYDIEFSFLGKQMSFRCLMDEFRFPESFRFRTLNGPFEYKGCYTLTPIQNGASQVTTVLWQFWVEPKGFFGIVPTLLLEKTLLSQYQKDAASLIAWVEQANTSQLLNSSRSA